MHVRLGRFSGVTVGIALTLGLSLAAATAVRAAEPDFAPVDAYVAEIVERYDMPGGALVILDKTGAIHEATFGDWTVETVVPIASASKFLAAAAILRLVDRGVLSLDDTVSTYMPDIGGPSGDISLRQMLAATTGQEPYARDILSDPDYDMDQAVEAILRRDPVYEPGAAFAYGSAHMQIAGRMAEIATGKDWHTLFKEEIAEPLGLQTTAFGRLIFEYGGQPPVPTAELIEVGSAKNPNLGSAAQSNALDYTRFLSMLLHDGMYGDARILDEETVDAMLADQTGGAFIASSFWPDKSIRYGFGNWLITQKDTGTTYHASDGAFGTVPWIERRHGIAGLFITYDNLFDWRSEALILRDRVASMMAEAAEPPAAAGPHD